VLSSGADPGHHGGVSDHPEPKDPRPRRGSRFTKLPDRILPEDMVEEVASDTAKDPDFGRNPDRDWLLRTT
jgi:hypothetical protein